MCDINHYSQGTPASEYREFSLRLTVGWPQRNFEPQAAAIHSRPKGEWSTSQLDTPFSRPSVRGKAPGSFPTCFSFSSQPVGDLPAVRLLQPFPHQSNPVSDKAHSAPKPIHLLRLRRNSEPQAAAAHSGPRGECSTSQLGTLLSRPSAPGQNPRTLPHLPQLH